MTDFGRTPEQLVAEAKANYRLGVNTHEHYPQPNLDAHTQGLQTVYQNAFEAGMRKEELKEAPETLTRGEYALVENWYDWYLNSPGGKWANQADKDLLDKIVRMTQ